MIGVGRIGPASPVRVAPRRPGVAGFRITEPQVEGTAGVQAVAMPSLLGLQEAGQDEVRDRDARRHGEMLLAGLKELQLAQLRGGPGQQGAALATLAARAPVPADPRLAGVQRALLVRAAIEAARGRAGGPS